MDVETNVLLKSLFSQRDMILEMDPKARPVFAGGLLLALEMMTEMAEVNERREMWICHGVEYGYPPCCIRGFVEGFPGYGHRNPGPWTGSGFVPCAECRPSAREDFIKFVQERILPFRRSKTPMTCRLVEGGPQVIIVQTEKVYE